MPNCLFKFVASSHATEFVLKGMVKFTPISELNDPSELSPKFSVDAVQESLRRLRRDGYSEEDLVHLTRQGHVLRRLAPEFKAVRVPSTIQEATQLIRSPFYDSVSTLERLLSETTRVISSKIGLFCLSQRYDSLPMWAHYAANANGLVIEFRDLETVFSGDETGVLRQPIAVRYDQDQPGVTFDPKTHESIFFDKFQDWSYEREVRVVLPLAECRREQLGDKHFYFYDIPAKCISRLILGWNMSQEQVAGIRHVAARINPMVEITQATFVKGQIILSGKKTA